MPDITGQPTLLDIAEQNGSDGVVGLIDEAVRAHPELAMGAARTINGMNYKTLVRIYNPSVTFRNANEGTAVGKGAYENRLVETFILNPPWECDKAVADSHEDGWQAYLALEGSGIMEGALQQLAKVFYYGRDATFGDAKGFPGLLQAYDSHATTGMWVSAGADEAAKNSSVWAVRFGPKHVRWVWGQNGQLDLSDVEVVRLVDAATNPYMAYHQELLAYPGLQVASMFSVGRIKLLGDGFNADGTTPNSLTDALLAQLLQKFPTGTKPDVFLMSRRSLGQLQNSRTATNPTGAPAPFPDSAFGIPIAPTDAISDVETLTL